MPDGVLSMHGNCMMSDVNLKAIKMVKCKPSNSSKVSSAVKKDFGAARYRRGSHFAAILQVTTIIPLQMEDILWQGRRTVGVIWGGGEGGGGGGGGSGLYLHVHLHATAERQ